MPLSEDRIYYYQRLAVALSGDELDKIENEVVDRFGVLAVSAKNMFDLSRLRLIYNKSFVSKIDLPKG